jgi:hypothetical protein
MPGLFCYWEAMKSTRLSVCRRKVLYASGAEAIAAAVGAPFELRPYRCDRCRQFHLTSRTRGKKRLPLAPASPA